MNQLRFENQFVQSLPADSDPSDSRRQVQGACYSYVSPIGFRHPELIAYAREVAELLGILSQGSKLSEDDKRQFAQLFSGNQLPDDMKPYANCYGGHQFGNWAGQLGDGRAINLGELLNPSGQRFILQLKGAGPTPYSRTADGLAVLRSSIREFLCSEAMYHLGVPTTRALSLVLTGEKVMRDMFYDGHAKPEPGAVVCRVAPSFTRFGSFEIFAARGEIDLLKQLADYTIETDFPHLGKPSKEVYLSWFREVAVKTAEMIVHWQRVGFVHGVMNTDNMSILGLTIDYGPYGWLDNYDPGWTPNTTDAQGRRYCFANQPQIALWNLTQLANAIFPLVNDVDPLKAALNDYSKAFNQGWLAMMLAKLGLQPDDESHDQALIKELLELLTEVETDMTIFFRRLADLSIETERSTSSDREMLSPLVDAYYLDTQVNDAYAKKMADWIGVYLDRLRVDGIPERQRRVSMNAVNPKYVLRNYMAQMAIEAAEAGDYSRIDELLDLVRRPYDEQNEAEQWAAKRPDWARHKAGCSMLSCSS